MNVYIMFLFVFKVPDIIHSRLYVIATAFVLLA